MQIKKKYIEFECIIMIRCEQNNDEEKKEISSYFSHHLESNSMNKVIRGRLEFLLVVEFYVIIFFLLFTIV
jgi:hypothetical protein